MIRDDKNNKTAKRNIAAGKKTPGAPAPLKIKSDGYSYNSYNNRRKNDSYYVGGRENTAPEDMPENKYYSNIAEKIKLAKWLLIVFLILFIFGGMIFNSKELNADNLNYLLRYINIQGSNTPVKSEFYAELDEASSVGYYKNNIAVLRKNRLDIYDMNGKRNFTHKLVYSNPVLKTSERYIIAYDSGANKLEIFNSFSRVFEYKGDKPVYGADITDRGNAVYVTTEKGYKSAVYVLNSGFNVIYKCLFDKDYIVCADIDDRAERLAVAGFYARNGDYISRVILYETHSEEPVKKIEVQGELPYGVKLNDYGVFAAFENSMRFYDINGDRIASYDFMYRKIQKMTLTPKYAAVALNEKTLGTDDRILIFEGTGDIVYENVIGLEIMDMQFSQDYKFLYFLTRAGLYRVDVDNKTCGLVTDEYDETTNFIIYANEKNAFLSGLLKINTVDVR